MVSFMSLFILEYIIVFYFLYCSVITGEESLGGYTVNKPLLLLLLLLLLCVQNKRGQFLKARSLLQSLC